MPTIMPAVEAPPRDPHREQYKLSDRLACLEFPERSDLRARNAIDLLEAVAAHGLRPGRYYAEPVLLRRLFWWQDIPRATVVRWTDQLVWAGEVTIEPLARSCYGGETIDVVCVVNPRRFPRFANRNPIPDAVRQLVYRRDGYRCVTCGTTERLSLDHIHPWSLGGSDDPSNLQTMCRPCNSSKGNRVSVGI